MIVRDIIWYDYMILYDTVSYFIILYDIYKIFYDIILDYMIFYDIIWYHMVLYDIVWYYMIWYCMILHDTVWYYMVFVWYYVILYDILWYYMILQVARVPKLMHKVPFELIRIGCSSYAGWLLALLAGCLIGWQGVCWVGGAQSKSGEGHLDWFWISSCFKESPWRVFMSASLAIFCWWVHGWMWVGIDLVWRALVCRLRIAMEYCALGSGSRQQPLQINGAFRRPRRRHSPWGVIFWPPRCCAGPPGARALTLGGRFLTPQMLRWAAWGWE
jgi:hypothetical protein